jgi:hypothetical protein
VETVPWLPGEIPRWVLMWAIAVSMFAVLKALSFRGMKACGAPLPRKLAYLFLWPGMDARAFLAQAASKRPTAAEWTAAAIKLALGIGLILGSRYFEAPLLRGWMAMVGVVFCLHFGSFHLLSCFWRSRGIQAVPLMDRPAMASSVSHFWGKRWNVAFRDLTHRMIFLPTLRRYGRTAALMAGFIFSGVIHELAITVPAGGGYGRPMVFFILQGFAALFERSKTGTRIGLGKGGRGWAFTQGLLILTVALLFPPPFVLRIINPFCDFIHELVF